MAEPITKSSTETVSNMAKTEKIRVLYVDDDLAFLKIAKKCLELQGEIHVDTASSANSALGKLREVDYDVVVSDYHMPGKGDLEFLKELREENNGVPFIIFTGKGREELAIKELLDLGVEGYFEKYGEPEVVYRELAHGISEVVEKKGMKDALRSSEAKHKSLLQNIPGMFYRARSDWSTEIIANSKSVCGYAIQEFDSKRVNWLDLIHPEDKARVVREGGIILEGPASITQEYRIVDKESKVRLVEDHKTSFFSKKGVFEGIDGVVFDVTGRKKTEQALQASLDRYQSFIEVTEDLGWTTNADGEVVEDTPSFRKFSGRTYEEVKGRGWSKALHPDDLERTIKVWEEATRTKSKYETEFRLRRHDGVYRYFMARGVPVFNEDGSIGEWVGTCIDITERKKAERELLIKDNAITSSVDGIAIANLQGTVTYVNPAFVKMWGYDSDKDFIGKSIAELTLKGQSKEKTDEILKALGTKGGWTGEMTATRKDGSKFYAILSASLVKDEAGKPICTLGSFVDVTDRKKGEEALKESEERLRQLIEYAPDAIYTNDLHGNFIDGNKQAENMTGFKKEELVGKNILEAGVLPKKYAPKVMQDLVRALKGQRTGPDEYELIRKDGSSVTAEISTFPIRREGKIEVIGIARDITERKQANKKLRESEEKLRNTIESSPDAITITDLEGIIVDCNQASVSVNGFSSKEELIGKSSLTLIAKKDRTSVRARYQRAMENIKITAEAGFLRNAPYTLTKKDGHEYPAELSASVLKDASGNPAGFVSIVRDVTDRKQMQEKLEEYSQQLEKMVEYRTKQLEDAQQQLVKVERLAAIGQVAAMVGHDLRNPLTGINGAAYYLKMKLGPNTEKNMLEMLNIIERDVQYSNNIITDLTEYSKEIKLELTETTPKSIIEESISLLQIPKKVQLTDSTLNEPRIKIDIEKMKRVFSNFIKNAVESMPQGGKLTITSRASKNDVELTFVDNGVGMTKDVLEKIWKPFFTTKAKGMGLGLAICRRIIEAHQGKISVESIVGEGTTFTITIPIEPKPRAEGGEKVWVNMPESLLLTTTKA